jgi:beta-glucanase (GH16 family)
MRRKLAGGMSALALMILGAAGGVPAVLAGPGSSASAATVSGASSARLRPAVPPPSGKPEFSATFTGSKLNTKVWDTCYPWLSQSGCTNFGNAEYEWYLPSQVKVSGGLLRLTATRKQVAGTDGSGAAKTYSCRSGLVTSHPGFNFKYGFVQIVADVPHKTGLWPALWLHASDEKFPPEIDMLESWGVDHEEASFFHPIGAKWSKGSIRLGLTKGWQTYSVRWTPSRVTYYVGTTVVLTITSRVPHQKMYIVANVADYVNPKTGGGCSGTMLIKSIKVWK